MVLPISPVNVPLTPVGFGVVTGVGVDGGGVDGGGFDGGVVLVLLGVDPRGVGFFVGFFVGLLVAAGVGVLVMVVCVGVGVLVAPPPIGAVPPDKEVPVPRVNPVVDPNCGGVIASTAPKPPTVPPAINKKRLLSMIYSFRQPSEIQILRCGSGQPEFPRL